MTQEGFKRKLAAIFSADAIGYSRLMGDDETTTVGALTSCYNVISTPSGDIKTLCISLNSLSHVIFRA